MQENVTELLYKREQKMVENRPRYICKEDERGSLKEMYAGVALVWVKIIPKPLSVIALDLAL